MGYTFPDVEAALLEILAPLGDVYLWQPADFASRITPTNPAHHVYNVGGSESGPLRTSRVEVATYGAGRDAAVEAAEASRELLTAGPHLVDGVGLLDLVRVDVPPRGIPYADDRVNQVNTTYRVDTRAI